jgi:glyoxylase-like metal-dependent hydrolase (beta-lactamase superfamily II)
MDIPGLELIRADNSSPLTGRGTNTYVLGEGDGVAVIDPGPADRGHLQHVAAAAERRGSVQLVLLTHHHPDHSAGARELAAMVGAPLAAIPHPNAPRLERKLADGDEIKLNDNTIEVMHTPGHCRDHACYVWRQRRAAFVGDLVAGEGFIVISPPDGNMADYIASLQHVRDANLAVLLPGHGPAVEAPADYLEKYIAHRLEREAKVVAALGGGPKTPLRLLPQVYDDTPKLMYPIALRSLKAHLEKLVTEARVAKEGRRYRLIG